MKVMVCGHVCTKEQGTVVENVASAWFLMMYTLAKIITARFFFLNNHFWAI